MSTQQLEIQILPKHTMTNFEFLSTNHSNSLFFSLHMIAVHALLPGLQNVTVSRQFFIDHGTQASLRQSPSNENTDAGIKNQPLFLLVFVDMKGFLRNKMKFTAMQLYNIATFGRLLIKPRYSYVLTSVAINRRHLRKQWNLDISRNSGQGNF